MKPNQILCRGLLVCFVICCAFSSAVGQDDTIFRIKRTGKVGKQTGKIDSVSKLAISFSDRTGSTKVPAWEIDKIRVASEPPQLDDARSRVKSGSHDEAIELLGQIKTGTNPLIDAEVDWYRALAKSEAALSGGTYSAVDAGGEVAAFLKNHPNSHHFVPATDLLGRLAMANGKLEFAAKQFGVLTKSKWAEYVARGHFFSGEAFLRGKKFNEAKAAYNNIIALKANDDITQRYKQLAQCQVARVNAMTGDPAASIAKLEGIISQENPDNTELFAYAYNALGHCYLKQKNLAEAEEKFLFTDLLFDTDPIPHAEAVFQLANIWNTQKQTDLSSEARKTINSRYRNTWWPSQLNQ